MLAANGPKESGPQYLFDLAAGYWLSEVLFAAVELDIFTLLEPPGKTAGEAAGALGISPRGAGRLMQALRSLGLLDRRGPVYFNTRITGDYLVRGKADYQGDALLWRKQLSPFWRRLEDCLREGGRVSYPTEEVPEQRIRRVRAYTAAMEAVANTKVKEFMPFFDGLSPEGNMLDVGSGSGAVAAAFLERFPSLRATLMDLPEVLDCAEEMLRSRGLAERVEFCRANVLEPWPVGGKSFSLIVLSNIIHAYSGAEIPGLLDKAAHCLEQDGIMVIHDFFLEHSPVKAALYDLNMFINTYNGMVFSAEWLRGQIRGLKLHETGLVPLKTDTALIMAAKKPEPLSRLRLDAASRLRARISGLGFRNVVSVPVESVHVPGWGGLRCRYGCRLYGRPHCPPDTPPPEKTREILNDYSKAFLLEGEPPTGEFQRRVLLAEREAFLAGFYKAFAFWAGPCSLCNHCGAPHRCDNTESARPSMEGAGIDVFETAGRAGIYLETLKSPEDYVKYIALLLLE